MLNVEDAILVENNIYYFQCSGLDCGRIIKSKPYYLKKHSGKCRSCINRKKPFEHVFSRFCNTARQEGHSNDISFDQFLKFIENKSCHYCFSSIPWMEYIYRNGKYARGGYFLDRKRQ